MEIERYFVIALSGTNVLSHQSGVFMLKDVAMVHEGMLARRWLIEGHE